MLSTGEWNVPALEQVGLSPCVQIRKLAVNGGTSLQEQPQPPQTKHYPAPTLLPLKPPSATYTACYHHSDPQLSRLVTATLVHPSHCHLQFLGLFHLSYCSLQSSSPLSQCQRHPAPANQLVLTTHWCPLKSLKRKHSPYMGWLQFQPTPTADAHLVCEYSQTWPIP